jgi:hypothetical protein
LALEAYADFLMRSKNKGKGTVLVIANQYKSESESAIILSDLNNLAKELKIHSNLIFVPKITNDEKLDLIR